MYAINSLQNDMVYMHIDY